MSIQIVINGENADEAIRELAVLSAGIAGRITPAESVPTPETPKTEHAARNAGTKPEPAKAPPAAPPESQDESGDIESEPDDDPDVTDEPIPTVVELRAKAQEIGKTSEGKKAIKDLLNKFGSKSISDIPENKRAAFLRALEELA